MICYTALGNYYIANTGLTRDNLPCELKTRHSAKQANNKCGLQDVRAEARVGISDGSCPFVSCFTYLSFTISIKVGASSEHIAQMYMNYGLLFIAHLNSGSQDVDRDVPEHIW